MSISTQCFFNSTFFNVLQVCYTFTQLTITQEPLRGDKKKIYYLITTAPTGGTWSELVHGKMKECGQV